MNLDFKIEQEQLERERLKY